ncbi:MAG: TetR/AcrR family transcriptional regulator, partial [Methylobacteriaceae bacterium]|nr:TetR/AcrR family transcriptional regulator [Methylobacteriaceae bacterium]
MPPRPLARQKLLDAAIDLIRAKGYAATSVDDLCAAAGVTKGAFFHHFESKQALAVAATARWSEVTDALFAAADYRRLADPLERLIAYLEFRRALLRRGDIAHVTCLIGTLAQETYDS